VHLIADLNNQARGARGRVLVGLWDIAAWRYDVMATLPLPQNRLPICPPSVATRCLLICTSVALSVVYIERSMGGRKNLTVLPPAHYAALVQQY
jgi:hypothetical protein